MSRLVLEEYLDKHLKWQDYLYENNSKRKFDNILINLLSTMLMMDMDGEFK